MVFVSYKRKDKSWVDALLKVMSDIAKDNGYRFVYDGELVSGQPWDRQVHTYLRQSECVLAILSEHSHECNLDDKQDNYYDEVSYALSDGKLVALEIPGLDESALPYNWRRIHRIQVHSNNDLREMVSKINDDILTTIGRSRREETDSWRIGEFANWAQWLKDNQIAPIRFSFPSGSKSIWLTPCPLDLGNPTEATVFFVSERLEDFDDEAGGRRGFSPGLDRQGVDELIREFRAAGQQVRLPFEEELQALRRLQSALSRSRDDQDTTEDAEQVLAVWCEMGSGPAITDDQGHPLADPFANRNHASCVLVFDLLT